VFWKTLAEIEEVILSGMVAMMALRRTPLPQPGWGLGRPSCSGIGASTVVRAAVSSAGPGHGGGRGSVLAQTGFCQLRHFSEVFGRVATPLVEEDRRLLPPPIDPGLSCRSLLCERVRACACVGLCGLACVCA
jgi:hypothetical protein